MADPSPPLEPERIERIRELAERGIPFNRLLGVRASTIERGRIALEIPFRDELVGDVRRPAIHGGVLSALADATGGIAVWTLVDPEDRVSTVDLRVDYLRPARARTLTSRGEVLRLGNRVGVARIQLVQDGADGPVAEATGVFNVRRGA